MGGRHSEHSARHRRVTAESFAPFAVTVDVILMTILRGELRIFLIQRGTRPHLGEWALPGGLVMTPEPLEEAALRMVHRETGLAARPVHVEQLRTYGNPARDPRTRVLTVAYWAVAPLLSPGYFDRGLIETSTAIYAEFIPVPEIESGRLRLAFDHARIVSDALGQVRSRLETTTLARRFCPPEFTISQLREVYEAVWGRSSTRRTFSARCCRARGSWRRWRSGGGRRGGEDGRRGCGWLRARSMGGWRGRFREGGGRGVGGEFGGAAPLWVTEGGLGSYRGRFGGGCEGAVARSTLKLLKSRTTNG